MTDTVSVGSGLVKPLAPPLGQQYDIESMADEFFKNYSKGRPAAVTAALVQFSKSRGLNQDTVLELQRLLHKRYGVITDRVVYENQQQPTGQPKVNLHIGIPGKQRKPTSTVNAPHQRGKTPTDVVKELPKNYGKY